MLFECIMHLVHQKWCLLPSLAQLPSCNAQSFSETKANGEEELTCRSLLKATATERNEYIPQDPAGSLLSN